jgi:methionine sulfoxide reductase heme-binding subunit
LNRVVKILGHWFFALTVLVTIGAIRLVVPALRNGLGANPLEELLHRTGEIAIWTLGSVLALTPLRVLFPGSRVVAALNRHRRLIGVTSCVYGLLHFTCHFLYEGGWDGLVKSFSNLFIWFGFAGLSILVLLTLTSNQWTIRGMGGVRWKQLHRLVYVAAGLLIYHQAIAGKGHWEMARWLLFALLLLESARLLTKRLARRPPPSSSGRAPKA